MLPGPDADVRLRGVERGLVHFTNALQRVAIDASGIPVEHPHVAPFAPVSSAGAARGLSRASLGAPPRGLRSSVEVAWSRTV